MYMYATKISDHFTRVINTVFCFVIFSVSRNVRPISKTIFLETHVPPSPLLWLPNT